MTWRLRVNVPLGKCTDVQESKVGLDEEKREQRSYSQGAATQPLSWALHPGLVEHVLLWLWMTTAGCQKHASHSDRVLLMGCLGKKPGVCVTTSTTSDGISRAAPKDLVWAFLLCGPRCKENFSLCFDQQSTLLQESSFGEEQTEMIPLTERWAIGWFDQYLPIKRC